MKWIFRPATALCVLLFTSIRHFPFCCTWPTDNIPQVWSLRHGTFYIQGQQYYGVSGFYLSRSPALIQLLLAVVTGPKSHNDTAVMTSTAIPQLNLSSIISCTLLLQNCLCFTKHKISKLAWLLGYFVLLLLVSFWQPKSRCTLKVDSDVREGFIVQIHEHRG
jgi:hypothetical protein